MQDTAGSVTSIFHRLREGDRDSARELWERYFPRLRALARRILAGRELPAGPDDAVQAAFFNFVQRIESGQVDGDSRRDELWKLLSMMTAQKARKLHRTENAKKRNAGRTVREVDLTHRVDEPFSLDELWGVAAPPDCDLICEDLLNQLDPDLREIAILRLAGYLNAEIKQLTGFPLRSIERRLQLIRAIWTDTKSV